jgi:hypothetical protein
VSLEATNWAWRTTAEHGSRLVLLALADCHNGTNGLCCPSVAHLVEMTRLERKAVMRGIADLEALGLVSVTRHQGTGSSYALAMGNQSQKGTGPILVPVPKRDGTGPILVQNRSHFGTRNRKEPEGNRNLAADAAGDGFQLTATEPKPTAKPRKADPLFETLAEVCGQVPSETTPQAEKATAVALAGIRKARPTVTPEEIRRRAANYRTKFPGASLTPQALAKHWPTLGAESPEVERANLEAELPRHPGNRESAAYHAETTTPEQVADFRTKAARLRQLKTS